MEDREFDFDRAVQRLPGESWLDLMARARIHAAEVDAARAAAASAEESSEEEEAA